MSSCCRSQFYVGLNALLWIIVLSRLSMPFLAGLIVLQFFNTPINASLANWMTRSLRSEASAFGIGNPFRRNRDIGGVHSLLRFFRCVYPARGQRVVPHAQRTGAGTRDSKDASAAGGIANAGALRFTAFRTPVKRWAAIWWMRFTCRAVMLLPMLLTSPDMVSPPAF